MFEKSAFPNLPLFAFFILCYLCLLGHYHIRERQSVTPHGVRVAEELHGELPKELADMALKPQAKSVTPPQNEVQASTFRKGTLPTLAPSNLAGESRFNYYRDLADHYGMRVEGLTVLGFRGLSPQGVRHPSGDNASNYDDTFVILDPYQKSAMELLGSTHAGQFTSTLSPDGVAQIKPGRYRAIPAGEFADMPCWLVITESGDESIPTWRDANGNGFIDPQEKSGHLLATEILFHNGRYKEYGSSIGCQVLPPRSMETFIDEIGQDNSFEYLLLDANQK